jgi:hypothetical protein
MIRIVHLWLLGTEVKEVTRGQICNLDAEINAQKTLVWKAAS